MGINDIIGDAVGAAIGDAPRYFLRVQAIVTGNDSPNSPIFIPTDFQPHHITQMISDANVFLDAAGIELVFDPARNIAKVHSTVLNTFANGPQRVARAKRHLTKLVIYFSDDTKDNPVKPSGSSLDDSFLSMRKGPASGAFLVHEIGHYLHLQHTFPEPINGKQVAVMAEVKKVIKNFVEAGSAPIEQGLSVFDSDAPAITDTPPDLGAAIYQNHDFACFPDLSFLTLQIPVTFSSGQTHTYSFSPNRLNLMSYFFSCDFPGQHFSPQQQQRMRDALRNLNRRHLVMVQDNWRYCKNCQGLFFAGLSAKAPCVTGGQHNSTGSLNYTLIFNSDEGRGQSDWRFCKKCLCLFFGGSGNNGMCVKSIKGHDGAGSGDYTLLADSDVLGQNDWRWCSVCQSLFFGQKVAKTKCPIVNGMPHKPANSFDYTLITN